MTSLTLDEMDRVAGEDLARDLRSEEWCEAEGIELEVMREVLQSAYRNFVRKVMEDGDGEGALLDVGGQLFRLGWEARART